MGVTLDVPLAEIREVEQKWDAVGDELDVNWRRLHLASTTGFSAAVTAAVDDFREPWVDLIKSTAGQATDHAEAIATFRRNVMAADRAQGEAIRALLPWARRDATITEW